MFQVGSYWIDWIFFGQFIYETVWFIHESVFRDLVAADCISSYNHNKWVEFRFVNKSICFMKSECLIEFSIDFLSMFVLLISHLFSELNPSECIRQYNNESVSLISKLRLAQIFFACTSDVTSFTQLFSWIMH